MEHKEHMKLLGCDTKESVEETVAENHNNYITLKAELARLVERQDAMIMELQERAMKSMLLVKGVPLNFKTKLTDKPAPGKIIMTFPDNDSTKVINVFISNSYKQPTPTQNSGSYIN